MKRPSRSFAFASLLCISFSFATACVEETSGEASSGKSSGGKSTGSKGSGSNGAGAGAGTADPLPPGTLLYVRSVADDTDHLIRRDLATGAEQLVTDLTGDGSDGWEIDGYALSPDRKRITIASLYGPTKEDTMTGLATSRIWTLGVDGSDFVRLTPPFENMANGRSLYSIEVDAPAFSADGANVLFDFGEFWYEGTQIQGGGTIWQVATDGESLPQPFTPLPVCTVYGAAPNPATGEVLAIHSICVNRAEQGLWLYPKEGMGQARQLLVEGYGEGEVEPSLETASWVADGSGFVFVGLFSADRGNGSERVRGLLLYDLAAGAISAIVVPPVDGYVWNAAIAPDASAIAYCLKHGDVYDLHLIDLTVAEPTDQAITSDGVSCQPRL